MNIAIICEYNPFHNGHKFQIDKIREKFGKEAKIIAIMSGNFVQRGDFAIFDKHSRALMAVNAGVDVVFELPLVSALSSAEDFAKGAVHILEKLGNIDYICFGSECGNIDILNEIATLLLSNNLDIKQFLDNGISYPKAISMALEEINPNFSQIVSNPNNTLGIEYIKALKVLNSAIKPFTIKRESVDHHATTAVDNFASASYIRENIKSDISHLIPTQNVDIFNALEVITPNENAILSYLKHLTCEDFAEIHDVTEGLENKIVKALKTATTLDELYENIKSKRYTLSKIRRIIIKSYIKITKNIANITPNYVKVLTFNDKGADFLKSIKKTTRLSVITKPSTLVNLTEIDKKLLKLDEIATDLYFMASKNSKNRTSSKELTTSPIYHLAKNDKIWYNI